MKKLIVSFLMFAATLAWGDAKFPHAVAKEPQAWENSPVLVMDIKWHRTTGLPFVEDGVCHLVYQDFDAATEDSAIMKQVQTCAEKGASKKAGDPLVAGAERVHLYRSESQDDIWEKIVGLYGGRRPVRTAPMCTYGCIAAQRGWSSGVFKYTVAGVYFKRDNFCGVVVTKDWAFGHEFKHCVDGQFHDAKEQWLNK